MQAKLSMFQDKDQEEVKRELDCCKYLMMNALEHLAKGEFGNAAMYHENLARSLHNLQTMKNRKEMNDEAYLILKQIEGERQQRELLRSLKV